MIQRFKNFISEPYYRVLNWQEKKKFQKDKMAYPQVYKKAMTTYRQFKDKNTSPHEKQNLVGVLQHHQSELKKMELQHHPVIKVKDHYGFLHMDQKDRPLKYWSTNNLHKFSKDFSYTYPEMEKLTSEKKDELPEEFYSNHFSLHPSDKKNIKNEIERREFLNAKF